MQSLLSRGAAFLVVDGFELSEAEYFQALPDIERFAKVAGDLSHVRNGVRRVDELEVWEGASLASLKIGHDRIRHLGCKPARRGSVVRFSPGSRRRLMFAFAKIRRDSVPMFVTLTYPDNFPAEPSQWKTDFQTLWKRITRRWPGAACMWRLELKRRKSGVNAGKVAPHYHLMLWGVPYDECMKVRHDGSRWFAKAWYQVVDSGDQQHLAAGVRVEKLRSMEGGFAYASKYLGKDEEAVGIASGLAIGRFWGVKGRKYLPLGRRVYHRILPQEVWNIRRAMARLAGLKPKSIRVRAGKNRRFGVFAPTGEVWMERVEGRCSRRISPLRRAAGLTIFKKTDDLVRLVREAWFF